MARKKQSVIWTICYVLWEDGDEDPFTATWFAYGKTKEEAKEKPEKKELVDDPSIPAWLKQLRAKKK